MAGYFFIALEDTGLVITVSVASHSGIPGHVPGSFLYNNSSICGLCPGHLLNVIINWDIENIWSVNIWFSEYKNRLAAKRTIGDEILFQVGVYEGVLVIADRGLGGVIYYSYRFKD